MELREGIQCGRRLSTCLLFPYFLNDQKPQKKAVNFSQHHIKTSGNKTKKKIIKSLFVLAATLVTTIQVHADVSFNSARVTAEDVLATAEFTKQLLA